MQASATVCVFFLTLSLPFGKGYRESQFNGTAVVDGQDRREGIRAALCCRLPVFSHWLLQVDALQRSSR